MQGGSQPTQLFVFTCKGYRPFLVTAPNQDVAKSDLRVYLDQHDALPDYADWSLNQIGARLADNVFNIDIGILAS